MVIENDSRRIKFSSNTLQVMKKYIQNDDSYESGGILIGRENSGNTNLIIEFITEPMSGDKSSRCRFFRKDIRHIQFFKKIYEESEGIYRYIGEWHTHPEIIPHYSSIDLKNWEKIGKEIKVRNQYHVIVGIQELGIWEYDTTIKKVTQIDSVNWRKVLDNENNFKKV